MPEGDDGRGGTGREFVGEGLEALAFNHDAVVYSKYMNLIVFKMKFSLTFMPQKGKR